MNSIAHQAQGRKVAIGVDTHKHIHVAVALAELVLPCDPWVLRATSGDSAKRR